MEVVNKEGIVIKTNSKTVTHDKFLDIMKQFKEIRVGVDGSKPPFKYVYLEVKKKEVVDVVKMNKMEVTYSIMYNSRHDKKYHDVLYISKMRMTLLDDEKLI